MAAKAKAMYGERLQSHDYQTLLQKKNVSDIAAFLKKTKLYGDSLEGINVKGVHRGQLELLLRMDVYDRQDVLLRYADASSKRFTCVSMMQTEIQLILMCVQSLKDDSMARDLMIARMPMYMQKDASFDLKALGNVTSYDGLLSLMKHTVYYRSLRIYAPSDNNEIDTVGLEHELNRLYYEVILKMVDDLGSAKESREVRKIITAQVELENLAILYRLKKYFNASSKEIKHMMRDVYCMFKPYEINDMIDHCDADEVLEKLETKYKMYLKDTKFTYIEQYIKVIRFNMNYHYFQFSTAPNTTLISYFILSGIEVNNLIDIVEGVHYGIPQERIRCLLVY